MLQIFKNHCDDEIMFCISMMQKYILMEGLLKQWKKAKDTDYSLKDCISGALWYVWFSLLRRERVYKKECSVLGVNSAVTSTKYYEARVI